MASKGQKFRKWSKEEILEIVKKHLEDHISMKELSKEYGPTSSIGLNSTQKKTNPAWSVVVEGIRMPRYTLVNP